MPYARRRYSRRYRRRGAHVPSTRRIYLRTGAKAQATQIAALARSVRGIRRSLRPDIKCYNISPQSLVWTNGIEGISDFADPLVPGGASNSGGVWYFEWLNRNYPQQGVGDSQRTGDKIRLNDMQINMEMSYATNLNNAEVTIGSNLINPGCFMRVLVIQGKASGASSLTPTGQQLLQWFGSSGTAYSNMVASPLAMGVTERFHILADRKYSFTIDRPNRIIKLRCKPAARTVRYSDSDNACDKTIGIAYFVSGLQYSLTTTERLEGTRSLKFTFTDM